MIQGLGGAVVRNETIKILHEVRDVAEKESLSRLSPFLKLGLYVYHSSENVSFFLQLTAKESYISSYL